MKHFWLAPGLLFVTTAGRAAAQVSAPEKDRPLITILLLLGETEPDTRKKLYGVFQCNPKLCDEVWFSVTGKADRHLAHRVRSVNMAKAAADLRKIGMIPSLHLERSMGYGADIPEEYAPTALASPLSVTMACRPCRRVRRASFF